MLVSSTSRSTAARASSGVPGGTPICSRLSPASVSGRPGGRRDRRSARESAVDDILDGLDKRALDMNRPLEPGDLKEAKDAAGVGGGQTPAPPRGERPCGRGQHPEGGRGGENGGPRNKGDA